MTGYLIGSNIPKNLPEWQKFVKDAEDEKSTALEFRGDGWDYKGEPELPFEKICSCTDLPLIVTIMPKFEYPDSKFPFGEEERRELLYHAIDVLSEKERAQYVTIELNADKILDDIISRLMERGVHSIVGHHEFSITPPQRVIRGTIREEKAVGADVAKVGYMANNGFDALNTMNPLVDTGFRESIGIPMITLSMGKYGRLSRLVSAEHGFGSFGSVGPATAPGQYSIREMREILKVEE